MFLEKKENGWNYIYIVEEFGGFLNFLGIELVEKFMNINGLDEKFILNFWLGGVVKQEKDHYVITTERSLLFTK